MGAAGRPSLASSDSSEFVIAVSALSASEMSCGAMLDVGSSDVRRDSRASAVSSRELRCDSLSDLAVCRAAFAFGLPPGEPK